MSSHSNNDDQAESDVAESDAIRKLKREAHLTAGCGHGRRKTEKVDFFWNVIWPDLVLLGWTKVERREGAIDFIPEGVDKATGKRGEDYYDRIRSVIDRLLRRRNKSESAIADKYVAKTSSNQLANQKSPTSSNNGSTGTGKRGRGRPRRNTPVPSSPGSSTPRSSSPKPTPKVHMDLSWKDGGTSFPKRVSQVGARFQATMLPRAGAWKDEENKPSESYCYQVYNPEKAKEHCAPNFLETDYIPHNKKEQMAIAFHEHGYDAATFDMKARLDEAIAQDGSEWTDAEKERFHAEIFRLRKDINQVAKAMGKSVNNCLAYYFGKFKKSDHYRLLKTVCFEEKAARLSQSEHDFDACGVCGDGGSLLICDGCEGEFHMTCMHQPLQSVPEGKWECDECVDRNLLEAKDSLIRRTKLYERVRKSARKRSHSDISSGEQSTDEATSVLFRPASPVLEVVKRFAANISAAFTEGPYGENK